VPRTDGPAMDEESVIRLRNAVLRVARRLRTSGDPEGLTATQSSVLATLVRQGPMRAGDLADAEALNPTLLSRVLGHLEGRGLVARGPDPEDGRATLARPTPDGRRLVERLRERRAALLVEWLGGLTPAGRASLLAALPALEELAEGARA
jgi:DNA-binding MarR family transcriptional regulator